MKKPISFQSAHRRLHSADAHYRALAEKHGPLGFKPKLERSPFESLVRAIAHQQLNGTAAETILGRLLAKFPDKPFPSPPDILALDPAEFRRFGYSERKTKSIRDIARKTIEGVVPDSESILLLGDEEITERLTGIYGVGEWTVQMLLIFQLGRLDIWPVDDFGVRAGFKAHFKKRDFPKPKDLRAFGARWAPYRTLAALYLWREADAAKKLKPKPVKTPSKSKRPKK